MNSGLNSKKHRYFKIWRFASTCLVRLKTTYNHNRFPNRQEMPKDSAPTEVMGNRRGMSAWVGNDLVADWGNASTLVGLSQFWGIILAYWGINLAEMGITNQSPLVGLSHFDTTRMEINWGSLRLIVFFCKKKTRKEVCTWIDWRQ